MDFSRAECLLTSVIGQSASARRWHALGIIVTPDNYLLACEIYLLASDYLLGNPYLVPLVEPAILLILPAFSNFFSRR
ncbi:MAG: hypothetical protein KatS3mg110_2603 [Pirellulaceae bacterium]|nr:MAG: hypothetical protein KatS3mg110_2603 [Pirellulaceae bacterium]